MVEELAFLVKDNLPCKHLILSMEDYLVNFLHDDSRSDGVLELEPTNAYNRLLLHRLAEIFGFSHQSVGEGDDRHLVLERCQETSIPSVLVSDLLWEYDELQPLTSSYELLRINKIVPVNDAEKIAHSLPISRCPDANLNQTLYDSELTSDIAIGQLSLEEREAAYVAARERIFAGYDGETNRFKEQKPRSDPVVARRMISHALGRKLDSSNRTISREISGKNDLQTDENFQKQDRDSANLTRYSKPDIHNKKIVSPNKPGVSGPRTSKIGVDEESLKQEHTGAAKRMFAHALGFPSGKDGIRKNALK